MTHPSPTVPAPLTEPPRTQCRAYTPKGPTAVRALGVFAAARLTGLLAVTAVAHATGQDTFRLLGRSWDSRWYTGIAAHGYGRTLHFEPGVVQSDLAFFPLYPGLIRAVTTLTPLSHGAAGLLVSWLAAGAAALGIYALAARLYDRRTATVLVLLWGLMPHSVILSMAYTEPVLTALAAWSLYALLTRRWLWAGALAALAGLARPNGFAVAAAVLAVAVYEIARRRGRGVPHRLWTGALLAPLGWAAYVLWVGVRRGDALGGYFAVQRGWGSRFDFGAGSFAFAEHLLLHGDKLVHSMTLVIVAVAVLLFALLVADRAPLPLLVYTGVLLLITVGGSGFFESKPRFLLPAFPLLIPLALAVTRTARARPRNAYLVVGALAGLSVAYGTYLVAIARMPL
ncbi:glycosyltransferase family 39 protein [Streptomyces aureoverticillatus]|uniref:glycosyltransferase family 39 protein n=1 Tax=Streptomyces aureoverticillatus TaxID=66871 RepID=UPI0035C72EF6